MRQLLPQLRICFKLSGNCSSCCKSLIPSQNSLFLRIVSLLICVGNWSRNGCGSGVSCYQIACRNAGIAKFPAKFPVSRELAWRQARSALRRQPPLANEFRHFLSRRGFHSEWRLMGHSEWMLPFGSQADVRGVSLSLTASVRQFAWHIRHNFGDCGGPIKLGLDRQ